MGISIYSVEGAVWACLTVSWLAIRNSASKSPLEEASLVVAAALAFTNLLCTSFSQERKATQRLYFQLIFAVWVAFAYEIADCLTASKLSDRYLNSPGIGRSLSIFSAAVSLALLTVQMLIAAAAVPELLWQGTEWTDVLVALAASFQACAHHGNPQSVEYALSVLVVMMSFCVLATTAVRLLAVFPPTFGIGLLSVDQILQIINISLKVVSSGFALGLAYSTGSPTWALPLVLFIPIALNTVVLIFESNYRELQGDQRAAQPRPTQPQPQPAPRPPQPQTLPTPRPVQPQPAPRLPQPRLPARPAVPQPQPESPATASLVYARQTPASPQPAVSDQFVTSRISQDALLFRNTRPLVAKNKKMS
jgi:hypothetical protein